MITRKLFLGLIPASVLAQTKASITQLKAKLTLNPTIAIVDSGGKLQQATIGTGLSLSTLPTFTLSAVSTPANVPNWATFDAARAADGSWSIPKPASLVIPASLMLFRNGLLMRENTDYAIDYVTGVITDLGRNDTDKFQSDDTVIVKYQRV